MRDKKFIDVSGLALSALEKFSSKAEFMAY